MEFKQLNIPRIDLSNSLSTSRILSERITAAAEAKERRYIDGVNREERMIELLESIDNNTSILPDMMRILEENTKDQKEILAIINEFNKLATIEEKEEKQSLYRKIMTKINTVISDVETVNTLISYGMFIYNTLQAMGKI